MTFANTMKAAALVGAALFAGALLGVSYERHRSQREVSDASSPPLHRHLKRALGLTATQDSAVAEILTRHQRAVDSAWRTLQPHVRANMDSTFREIAAVLTPEQLDRFRKLAAERHPGALP